MEVYKDVHFQKIKFKLNKSAALQLYPGRSSLVKAGIMKQLRFFLRIQREREEWEKTIRLTRLDPISFSSVFWSKLEAKQPIKMLVPKI